VVLQYYQDDPTDFLALELVEAYKAVNLLCVSVAKKYCGKEGSLNLDQPFTLSRELLELDTTEEEWRYFEENTLEQVLPLSKKLIKTTMENIVLI
jgi:hypothetical protein